MRRLLIACTVLALLVGTGCKTTGTSGSLSKKGKSWQERRGEPDADLPTPEWWYARRVYDKNYMHWGKMRHPDAGTRSENWVLLDERQCKAPHRKLSRVSADNGREYRFYGFFSENVGYEPASDEICPIFVLQRWEMLNAPVESSNPPPLEEASVPQPSSQ